MTKHIFVILGLVLSMALASAVGQAESTAAPKGATGTPGTATDGYGGTASTAPTDMKSPSTDAGGVMTNEKSTTGHKDTRHKAKTKDHKADNTYMNKSHNRQNEVADKQPMESADVETTRKIRQALMDKDALSNYGKNVKIITTAGKVTLKGPVNSAEEKRMIEEAAGQVAGVSNVVNELDVVRK